MLLYLISKYKLHEWINKENIDLNNLSGNENVIQLHKKNIKQINCLLFSRYSKSNKLLKENIDKVDFIWL